MIIKSTAWYSINKRVHVSKSFDLEKLKQKLSVVASNAERKFNYLVECINRFGFAGIAWWFKTQSQLDEFNLALQVLRKDLEQDDINLLLIEQTFTDFIVPEEDLGHVYWYTDAHNKLNVFSKKLLEKKIFDIKLLQLAMNEMKFISQSNEFHQLYQLQNIQQRVNDMYQQLQQKIVEQQSLEKQKIEKDKKSLEVDLAKQEADKAAAIVKNKMMESIKIKEKRLAIIEDKKRKEAEKEVIEIKIKEQNDQAEIRAKEADVERQSKLQESYRELELKEMIKSLPLEDLIEMLHHKIEDKKILTFIQLDQLSKLKHTIEDKKA